MTSILLFLGWLFLLIYVLLRASKYRKIVITLTILLFVPVACIVFVEWFYASDMIDCYMNALDQSNCTPENNYEYPKEERIV